MTDAAQKEKIEELLTRGVAEVIDRAHLEKQLLSGKKLRVKLGIDPTSPDLHIGRAVVLWKLRAFQDLGHKVVFIIGDFTGVIGDTSDKESERPMLTPSEVKKNMKTYLDQAGKILDMKKVEFHHNSEWLSKISYAELGSQADQFSLSEFISRENIKKRLLAGTRVSLRELLYPLMQGYDSVAVKADVELGGIDQRFNLLAGRTLQEFYKQPAQNILMTNLILGTDGRKMSSSWGNTINLTDEPTDMFGKVMNVSDEMMVSYFEHATQLSMTEVSAFEKELEAGKVNPRDIKMKLAYEITKLYSDEKKADAAQEAFVKLFQKKIDDRAQNIQTYPAGDQQLAQVLASTLFGGNMSQAKRMVQQGAVKVAGKKMTEPFALITIPENKKDALRITVGKRQYVDVCGKK